MYCPQCGTESSDQQQYCRACGANLKVIGKAVALSEAIARSDRGPLPKIREMVKGLTVDHVTDEVSRALEKMNTEIAKISPETKSHRQGPWINFRKRKTIEERREDHLTKGTVSLFSGIGLTIFLYYLSASIVLKLPPQVISQIPFEVESLVRVIWLIGLVPALSGFGHILAGLMIRPSRQQKSVVEFPPDDVNVKPLPGAPRSVTERTTNLLEHDSFNEPASRL